jgi:hypothetical protein
MNKEDVLAYVRQQAPAACPIVAGSAGTDELTPDMGVDGSDLEIAVVGWLSALRTARQVRRTFPAVETYFVAPWRMRWGLQRNLGVPRPNLPAFDLARQQRSAPLPRGSAPPRLWLASELTAREALTLMGNRIAVHLEKRTPYTAVKLAIAAGDAVLISRGLYDLGYARRQARFETVEASLQTTLATTAASGYEGKLTGKMPGISDAQLAAAVAEAFYEVSGGCPGASERHNKVPAAGSVFERVRRAWTEDARAARWGRSSVIAESLFAILRARKHLGTRRSVRLTLLTGRIEAAIYANLIARFIGCDIDREDLGACWLIPEEDLLPMWWAYCA